MLQRPVMSCQPMVNFSQLLLCRSMHKLTFEARVGKPMWWDRAASATWLDRSRLADA